MNNLLQAVKGLFEYITDKQNFSNSPVFVY